MTPRVRLFGLLFAAALAAIVAAVGCGRHSTPTSLDPTPTVMLASPSGVQDQQLALAIAIQEKYSPFLLGLAGVVGTGAWFDDAGRAKVVVLLKTPIVIGVPPLLDGVAVEKFVTGTLQPWALTGEYRPVPIGVSVGNADFLGTCVPGTIGCVVEKGGAKYLLSSNHVFARQNQAALGEDILQPGQVDLVPPCGPYGGSAVVAELSEFQPIVYDGRTENTMDAAIARVKPGVTPQCSTPPGYYGSHSNIPVNVEDTNGSDRDVPIMKLGRTTELTHGNVKAVNVKARIKFSSGTALFVKQIITSPGFGDAGDSGAMIVTDRPIHQNFPVGLIIGGGTNGAAIATPMPRIVGRFGVTICAN